MNAFLAVYFQAQGVTTAVKMKCAMSSYKLQQLTSLYKVPKALNS